MKIDNSNSVECVYVTPSTNFITLNSEGILCGSGVTIEDWGSDGDPLAC